MVSSAWLIGFVVVLPPEQAMKDRADYARKGIAGGRSVVALKYAGGVLFVADNPSATLKEARKDAMADAIDKARTLADAAVVGGVDTLCGSVLFGFNALGLVSAAPCRPFDARRRQSDLDVAADEHRVGVPVGEHQRMVTLSAACPSATDR